MRLRKKIDINYLHLDQKRVKEHFGKDIKYLGTIPVYSDASPSAIYFVKKPDLSKGHKNFMLLTQKGETLFVSGMTKEAFQKHRYVSVIRCKLCDSYIYSLHRHDMRPCMCKSVYVDGGNDYCKVSGDADIWELYKYDIIKGSVALSDN